MKKVALIIGGAGGIGSAVVRTLLKNGIMVYATYYEKKENIEKSEYPKNCQFMQCDIRKGADIARVIEHILNHESEIDIVVNTVTSKLKLKPLVLYR